MRELRQRWLDNNRDHRKTYMKNYNRKKKLESYGLTEEDFNNLFSKQGERCAICQTVEPTKKGWCVDHCHETERVRGILCDHCNLLLGYAKDKITTLETAVSYLKATQN